MKTSNKILAILTIAIMAMAILLAPVKSLADDETTFSLTVNTQESNKTVEIIELFKITQDLGNGKYNYDFARPEVKNIFSTNFGKTNLFDAIAYVEGITDPAALQDFADEFYGYATDSIKKSKPSGENTSVEFTGLENGYYLIYDIVAGATTPKSAAVLRNLTTDTTVTLKTEAITLDKKASVDTDSDTKTNKVSAEVGDIIYFEVTTQVPNVDGYDANELTFTITDNLSANLQYNNDVSVTIGGTPVTLGEGTFKNSGETGKIELKMGEYLRNNTNKYGETSKTYTPKTSTIVVKYSATLLSGAVDLNAGATTNTAKLTLSTTPTASNTTKTKDLNAAVNIYTYIVNIIKIDPSKADATNKLAGVKFKVKDSSGYITFIKPEGKDYYVKTGTSAEGTELTTDTNGNIKIAGLQAGIYTIEETSTIEGYSLPTNKDFPITISTTNDYTSATLSSARDDGYIAETSVASSDNKTFNITIKNAKEGKLPETGGMGTVIFTVVGISIMVAAGVLLVARNRRSQEN